MFLFLSATAHGKISSQQPLHPFSKKRPMYTVTVKYVNKICDYWKFCPVIGQAPPDNYSIIIYADFSKWQRVVIVDEKDRKISSFKENATLKTTKEA